MCKEGKESLEPEVGDVALVCDGCIRPGIKSGTITQWDEEQGVFTIMDEVTLESEQYLMDGHTFHFNVKGMMWFIDVK